MKQKRERVKRNQRKKIIEKKERFKDSERIETCPSKT